MNFDFEMTVYQPGSTPREGRAGRLYEIADSKLLAFLAYVALGDPETEFLVYSRSFIDEDARTDFLVEAQLRFPHLEGRVAAMAVPGEDRATFRDPDTAALVRRQVSAMLGLERNN